MALNRQPPFGGVTVCWTQNWHRSLTQGLTSGPADMMGQILRSAIVQPPFFDITPIPTTCQSGLHLFSRVAEGRTTPAPNASIPKHLGS